MNKKIFWDEQTGSVFWIENDEVMQAPMNNDSTCNLGDAGAVTDWESPAEKVRICAKLA